MSGAQPQEPKDLVIDRTIGEPLNTSAAEAKTDPIKPMATDSLTTESRPEMASVVNAPTPAAAAEPGTGVPKEEQILGKDALIESQSVSEGILGYKAPGLVKSLIYSKKFFWLGDQSIESHHLSDYLRIEKPEIAHQNVAHATQTGRGLLFFAKRAEDKSNPAGILNLSEVSDISKGDLNDFTFKLNGHKHGFQAPTKAERDGWLIAIESAIAEAQSSREDLVGSEGYKNQLEKLVKPVVPTTAATLGTSSSQSQSRPTKSTDAKVNDSAMVGDNVAIGGSSSDEGKVKNKSKSRSQSRKRGSFFGALLGKKEDHDEKKETKEEKEIKQETSTVGNVEKEETKTELGTSKDDTKEAELGITPKPAPLDAVAVASRALAEPVLPIEGTQGSAKEEVAKTESSEVAPVPPATEPHTKTSKRNSIFGSLFGKKDAASAPGQDTAPAVPAKDPELNPASITAPQIKESSTGPSNDPITPVPIPAPTVEHPETSPISQAPAATGTPIEKRRSSFFNNLSTKREKRPETTSDADPDAESKKFNTGKFGGLFRKPSRATPPVSKEASTHAGVSPLPEHSDAPQTGGGSTLIEPKRPVAASA